MSKVGISVIGILIVTNASFAQNLPPVVTPGVENLMLKCETQMIGPNHDQLSVEIYTKLIAPVGKRSLHKNTAIVQRSSINGIYNQLYYKIERTRTQYGKHYFLGQGFGLQVNQNPFPSLPPIMNEISFQGQLKVKGLVEEVTGHSFVPVNCKYPTRANQTK